jgi:gluconate:H+ symporter, GntP family
MNNTFRRPKWQRLFRLVFMMSAIALLGFSWLNRGVSQEPTSSPSQPSSVAQPLADSAPPAATGTANQKDQISSPAANVLSNATVKQAASNNQPNPGTRPLYVAGIGIVTVLGLMVIVKCNAFLALIAAALTVAILSGIGGSDPMSEVAKELGSTAGNISILIVMAAVVGKCMLDSGSADVIVNSALKITGEKRAAYGLMGSGFLLAIPVFFDTVFYLLVPLARSLYQRVQKNYLLFVMAISCGGAVTHTLVPPTPGPLLVAATLGADVGMVMLIGILVGIPTSIVGMVFCFWVNSRMVVPMRPLAGIKVDSEQNDSEDAVPRPSRAVPLWLALTPVVLPVMMITASTVITDLADREDRAALQDSDIKQPQQFLIKLREQALQNDSSPAGRIFASTKLNDSQRAQLTAGQPTPLELTAALNRVLLDSKLFNGSAFQDVKIDESLRSKLTANHLRTKPVNMRRLNRELVEATYPDFISPHQWDSPRRQLAERLSGLGNASFALGISAIIAVLTLIWAKHRSFGALAGDVEEAVMSAGLIVLITAAGGAFGGMLQRAQISEAIQSLVDLQNSGAMAVMVLGFGIAAVLKVAQGSSTVAMIVGSSMVAAMVRVDGLPYHAAYLVTAIGGGSLLGSWMNDSGFWVYAKMGGLTEAESLKTWTPLLVILGISALFTSLIFATVLPLK